MRACIPNMQQLVVAACSEQVVPNGQSSPPDCTLSASVKENWTLFRLHSWKSVHFRLHSEANCSFPFHPGFVNRTSCGITEQLSKCSGQEKQGTTLNCLAQNCLLVGIFEGKPISTPKTCISQELRLLQTESCSKERVVKLPTPKVHFPREEVSQEPDRVLFKGVGRRQLSGWLVPPQRPQECRAATLARAAALGLLQTLLHFVLRRDLPLLLRPACCRLSLLAVRGSVAVLELGGMSGGAFNSQDPHYQASLSASKHGSWENLTSGVSVLQALNTCNQTLL